MKVFVLVMAILGFISTAYAIEPVNASIEKQCIDVEQSLAAEMPEIDILEALIDEKCGMGIHEAVEAILAAGANFRSTLVAAMIIDPDFNFSDPTAGLEATVSGPPQPSAIDVKSVITTTTSPGGGASPA